MKLTMYGKDRIIIPKINQEIIKHHGWFGDTPDFVYIFSSYTTYFKTTRQQETGMFETPRFVYLSLEETTNDTIN